MECRERMNKIQSHFLIFSSITLGIMISCLNIFSLFCQLFTNSKVYKNNIQLIFGVSFFLVISVFLIMFGSTNRLKYDNSFIILHIFCIKREIKFSELQNIMYSPFAGGYWLNLNNNRHYYLFFPFCKKQLLIMSKHIKEINSAFDVLI